jgi:hypothetical protein
MMQHRNIQTMRLIKPAAALTMALLASAALGDGTLTTNQANDVMARLRQAREAEILNMDIPAQTGTKPEAVAGAAPGGRRNAGALGGNLSSGTAFDGIKSQIHATDEEWKIIAPVLQSITTLRQTANEGLSGGQGNTGFGGMMGGFGGPGGGLGGGDSFADPGGRGGLGGGGPGGFGGGGPGGFGGGGPGGFGGGGPGGFGGGGPGGFGGGGPGGFGGGGRGGFGGGGRGDSAGGATPVVMSGGNNAVALALAELKSALATTNTPPGQIKEQIAAVRAARQKARTDLAATEKKLRELLTADQEAVLISLGWLE